MDKLDRPAPAFLETGASKTVRRPVETFCLLPACAVASETKNAALRFC